MVNYKNFPTCGEVECFACDDGYCVILTKNDFGEKKCPFFKTKEQVQKEREYCRKRQAEMRKGE